MKTKIKQGFLSFPLALVLILGAFALWGNLTVSAATYSGECGDNLTWTLDTDTGVLTISGTGAMKKVYNSSWDNYRENITSVILSNGVTSIEYNAFAGCTSLTSITIPDGVTSIGSNAFENCSSLESVVIPDKVTLIGQFTFNGCTSLESVVIGNGVTSISGWAFRGCTSLASVEIPDKVTSIGMEAFQNCTSLASVVIPDSVTYIGQGSFQKCNSLKSVTIPAGAFIGSYAFRACSSLESINVDAENANYKSDNGILYNKNQTQIICYPAGKTETTFTIPAGVTSISNDAFDGCVILINIDVDVDNANYMSDGGILFSKDTKQLIRYPAGRTETTFTIPNSVTAIGYNAFESCTSLTSVIIVDGVTSIRDYAFQNCTSLASVVIPNKVTSIGQSAFENCTSLASIIIPEIVTSIKNNTFRDCTSLASVKIGSSVTSIEQNAFVGCAGLVSVVIPDKVTSIDYGAFMNCKELAEVYFTSAEPPTVVGNAFSNVKSGARAIVPENWGEGENGVAEGSKWNGLIVVYGEYAEPEPCEVCGEYPCVCPESLEPCEYCGEELCVCVILSDELKGDGKGKLGEIVTEPTGDNKIYIKGKANGTVLSDVTGGSVYEIIDGKEVSVTGDNTKLGTGMIIRNGAEEIVVVVTGDLTGKGDPNIKDAQVYLESLVGNTDLNKAQELATESIIAGKTESAIKNLRSFLNSVMKAGT